jgi:hypothetical protein
LLTAYKVVGFFDFSLLIWKIGKAKTANPLMFPLKDGGFLHSYYKMEKGSYFKAAICK